MNQQSSNEQFQIVSTFGFEIKGCLAETDPDRTRGSGEQSVS